MSNIILKFYTLEELCTYIKMVQPQGYTINTLQNSLTAKLSSSEVSLALEQYGAIPILKEVISQKNNKVIATQA